MANNEVKEVKSTISRSAAVEQLSKNDQILEGRIANQVLDKEEIEHLYDETNVNRKFVRDLELGNTVSTYQDWSHVDDRGGYSIWSYPVTDLVDNDSNVMVVDDKEYEYMGEADSESIDAFLKVLALYDGVTNDVTTEAGTEQGTAFCFIQDTDTDTYMLVCGESEYDAIDLDLETLGSNYGLKFQYLDGLTWVDWDGACTLSGFTDNTTNLHYSGRVEFNLPGSWETATIDGTCGHWGKLYTNSTPAVVAQAYHALPGDSVPTLLSLTEEEILDKDWKWCYFNDKVYVTIQNSGDYHYEGDVFIKSGSSTENLQDYFINNHEFKVSYEDEDYVAGAGGVASHHTSHENGGGDEIDVTGLSGELADNQPPKAHASDHQNGGSDEISVTGLSGVLGDKQDSDKIQGSPVDDETPSDNDMLLHDGTSWTVTSFNHASRHQNGGADEISVAGLSGDLADRQDADKLMGTDIEPFSPSTGDMLYYNGTSWILVPVGSDNQVLTLDGTTPNWETSSGGGSGKMAIWLRPGDAILPNSAFARLEKVTRTNGVDNVMKFDADGSGSDEIAYFTEAIPAFYGGGNITITIYSLSEETDTSRYADFHIEARAIAHDEAWDAAHTEIGNVFINPTASAEDTLVDTISWTSGLPTAGDMVSFKLWVDVDSSCYNTGDKDCEIIAIKIEED